MAAYAKPYDPNEGGAVKSGHVRVVLISTDDAAGVGMEVNRRDVAIPSGATFEFLYSDSVTFDCDYTTYHCYEEATQVKWGGSVHALDSTGKTPLSNFDGRTIFMPYCSK